MRVWLPAVRTGTGTDVFTTRLDTALRASGIESTITWFPAWQELMPELMRLMAVPHGTDVIHANGWLASPFLGRGVPIVATAHHLVHDPAYGPYRSTTQALYHNWHIRWRETRVLRESDAVTAISHYVAGTVRDFCGRNDVAVIPNWVDTARYVPDPSVDTDRTWPFRLLMVGNHSRRKGFDLLPELARELGPGFEVRCTGGLRVAQTTAIPNVEMLGRLTEAELIHEYQQCDAVLSLSRYEGFGYTALEGMACAKPFIGFRTSGLTEVVKDGVTGFLEPVDDVLALAARCRSLRNNKSLRQSMGVAGRERAIEKFAAPPAIRAYIATYHAAIQQRGRW
jgi:starch synthase